MIALASVEAGRIDRDQILAAMARGEAVFVKGASPGSPYHLNVTYAAVHAGADAAFEEHFGARSG